MNFHGIMHMFTYCKVACNAILHYASQVRTAFDAELSSSTKKEFWHSLDGLDEQMVESYCATDPTIKINFSITERVCFNVFV